MKGYHGRPHLHRIDPPHGELVEDFADGPPWPPPGPFAWGVLAGMVAAVVMFVAGWLVGPLFVWPR